MGELSKKPLLGVKPAWLVIEERNMDLTKAIWERTMQETKTLADYRLMVIWSTEIVMNYNMLLALDKTTKTLGEQHCFTEQT